MNSLLNEAGQLVIKDMEKAAVISAFFALVFTGKISLQESQACENRGKVWSKEGLSSSEEYKRLQST